jgi:hypothetical protein
VTYVLSPTTYQFAGVTYTGTATAGSGSGVAMTASGLDTVVIETGINARQALSLILAAVGGNLSGAATGVVVVKGGGVSATRITATTDLNGNRTSVTLSPPA